MINRELTRRVKFGQEVSWASKSVHSDILVTLDLVKALDEKEKLWEYSILESTELKVCSIASHLFRVINGKGCRTCRLGFYHEYNYYNPEGVARGIMLRVLCHQ